MFQVFATESVLYYHVGSPRFRTRPFWGEVFPDRETCQQACDELYTRDFPRFLFVHPREVDEPQENEPDDDHN